MSHPLHDPNNPATSWALNPWHPMSRPIDLKHMGKLAEELGEAQSAVSRCIIQGIDESEPVTHKLNKEWLEDELADVIANIDLVCEHFGLDRAKMGVRAARKKEHLRGWHSMLATPLEEDAAKVEREACAKIADSFRAKWSNANGFGGHSAAARIIAGAIRYPQLVKENGK